MRFVVLCLLAVCVIALTGCYAAFPAPMASVGCGAGHVPPQQACGLPKRFKQYSEPMHPFLTPAGQPALIPRSGLRREMQAVPPGP